jgi:thiosulfate/3-mercaptopyruvate sulfurtransferase
MAKTYPYPSGTGEITWVSTAWLEQHINDDNLTLLDTQPNIHDYISEHILGAVYFNPELLRVPYHGRPGVYIPEDAARHLFSRVGLMQDMPVVVYTGTGAFKGWGDGLEQTMVAYSLVRFGHHRVHVLDGGLDKWKGEGRPLSKVFPNIDPSSFSVHVRNEHVVSMAEVKELMEGEDVVLLDARPKAVYEGQGPWIKPGHIPGAINLPWKLLMDDTNTRLLKPDEKLEAVLDERGAAPDKTVVCSCGTGREATAEFILLKWYLGYPDVKIYEGSFTEWSAYPENPTVTGPNPY